ncbi:hypothetical protein QJS10_CPA16g01454 [Acorus calamus]|uniref:Uncharacterized protein n=1 Tax=Acorus calamus TaxID=4465 RepID=A0AAV9CXI0_ACOCL|nr:hypothetical protein QJS10_CPA16g01454 [Acorus calamus]
MRLLLLDSQIEFLLGRLNQSHSQVTRDSLTNSSVEHSPPTSPVGVLQGQENTSPDQNQHHHGDPHSPKEAGDSLVVPQPVWLLGVDLRQIPVRLLSQCTATSHRMESSVSKLVALDSDHLLEHLKNARSLSSSFTMNVVGTSYNEAKCRKISRTSFNRTAMICGLASSNPFSLSSSALEVLNN